MSAIQNHTVITRLNMFDVDTTPKIVIKSLLIGQSNVHFVEEPLSQLQRLAVPLSFHFFLKG